MKQTETGLRKHMSPLAAWAFSIGTSIGWGSLVVTSNTYLAQAGPLGSSLGLAAGTLIMLLIAYCYAYLMRCFPEAGGTYSFTREVFGYDQGFLTAWFLGMTYFAILGANATSLPLFARIFLGGVFRFGKIYTIFDYQVYLGEALLSVSALVLFGFVCSRFSRAVDWLMAGLALLFTVGIIICFAAALLGWEVPFAPTFVPDSSAIGQIVHIAVISPWAFIGFENISHFTEEFDFPRSRIRRVLLISVLATFALYVCITLLSVSAYPARYENWLAYIRDLENLSGLEALPAFYAAHHYLNDTGVFLLMLSLLALIITSLIGNMTALSRLFYALARDRILRARYAALNSSGNPSNAIWLVVGIACLIPLVGRTAIGWIVDVTTIGATLVYGFICVAVAVMGRNMEEKVPMWCGRIGLGIMLAYGAYILLPNLLGRGSMAKETYFLLIVWSVLGFLFFRRILRRDNERRFGGSVAVWIALLALVLFVSLIWICQSRVSANDQMLADVHAYFESVEEPDSQRLEDERFIRREMEKMEASDSRTMQVAVVMFCIALGIMMTNHSTLNKRSRESEHRANTDPLTGVKSRNAYRAKEEELDAAIRAGRAEDFSLVVCDVNGLKQINDTHGHKAGDEYIRRACRLVCEIFQHSPVYRIGGDEFVAILSGRDHAVRRELLAALHNRSVDNIATDGPVVAGGLAEYTAGLDITVHELFERADAQMYEEKMNLKGRRPAVREEEPAPIQPGQDDESPVILHIRRKLLIVESDPANRLMLGRALEGSYELLYAADGIEAMEQVRLFERDIALILLSLQLPRLSGIEVLQRLKDDAELQRIPVIAMTADQGAEVKCLQQGAMDSIPIPYPRREIIRARVNKCVELTENRDLIQSTERDALTGLFNVDYFLRYVALYDQHYAEAPMDAVVIELEHFDAFTKHFGRQYGEKLIQKLGKTIRRSTHALGGVGTRREASFLFYCPHRSDYAGIFTQLSHELKNEEESGGIELRMGVYAEADKALSAEERFERARLAARALSAGKTGEVSYYDIGLHEAAVYREHLLADFMPSLEKGCFLVFFQPKYDIRPETPVLIGAEALVRWNHPEYGMISPADFVPLLEENGLVAELDRYVWRTTAALIRSWKDHFGFSVPISVNVSRADMLTRGLRKLLLDILDEYGLSPADLSLEITESACAVNSDQVIATVQELHDMGVGFRIELEDFGVGYSSLRTLAQLPIDALKLDMSFVKNASGDNKDERVIRLVFQIAGYLRVPVVAEGVETPEQLATLRSMGCAMAQGFYFSRPVPAEDFEHLLHRRASQ